jgi:hypothetical protein
MLNVLDQSIQQNISTFVESQFPSFYREEGDMFIQFVKAYYEWMEQTKAADGKDGVTTLSRNLSNYRDIDNTLDGYLTHFQNEYLYGIPLYVQGDKRSLIKHALDVYRSKGTIQGYKLLFRLLYNEEIDVYIPKDDILRASDGQWTVQKYLEVTYTDNNKSLENVLVAGAFSGATAVIENYIQRNINGNFVNIFYVSNITGNFILNEPVIPYTAFNNQSSLNLLNYPRISGSVSGFSVVDGGQNFNSGDILNTYSALGTGAKFNVLTTGPKQGISFILRTPGYGFTANASKILTRTGTEPYAGVNAQFTYSIINQSPITYSNMLIAGYETLNINTAAYGMFGNTLANVNSAINNAITYVTAQAGQISNVVTSNGGVGYVSNPYVVVRDLINSAFVNGSISVSNTSSIVIGTGTSFTTYFANNRFLKVVTGYSNNTTDTIYDYRIVQAVANDTYMTLDDYPNVVANTHAKARLAIPLWSANYSVTDATDIDGNIKGQDEYVQAIAGIGNGTIFTASVLTSGLGYNGGEFISVVKANAISTVYIKTRGSGYANGETLVFAGGTNSPANGYINTFSNGAISGTVITTEGSGYQAAPVVKVQTSNGVGASLFAIVGSAIGTNSVVIGQVTKSAVGYEEGYWSTSRGFLNADKYIQDSYYYQDFSYAIKSGIDVTKYADVLRKVFHVAGTELFGKRYIFDQQDVQIADTTPALVFYTKGTGTITTSNTSNTVTGVTTLFTTQLSNGQPIYDQSYNLIGNVYSITSNTSLKLSANSILSVSANVYYYSVTY